MTTYEPGTVAVATVRGVQNVRIFRVEETWLTGDRVIEWFEHGSDDVTDVRPLVVLDLNEWAVETVTSHLRNGGSGCVCSTIADQIEAQTKPPRIPEPGLYGVVRDSKGTEWHHTSHGPGRAGEQAVWTCSMGFNHRWDEIVDPILVRDGI